MNRDDIIQMAREAGFEFNSLGGTHTSGKLDEHLERFAALVAAAEREFCKDLWEAQKLTDRQISDHIVAAVEAERAECARICDDEATRAGWNRDNDISINQTFWTGGKKLAFSCAEAIRARGNT